MVRILLFDRTMTILTGRSGTTPDHLPAGAKWGLDETKVRGRVPMASHDTAGGITSHPAYAGQVIITPGVGVFHRC